MATNSTSRSTGNVLPPKQPFRPPLAASAVVCIFAVGAFLPTRALWVQLPGTLADESSGHHLHLLTVCLLSNVAAVVYLVVRRCCCRPGGSTSPPTPVSDAAAIYLAMMCGLASLALLAIFHRPPSAAAAIVHIIPAWTTTSVLLTAAGLGAFAASMAAVTYIPFAGGLDDIRSAGGNFVCAVLIGDALSSLVPHLLALAQG